MEKNLVKRAYEAFKLNNYSEALTLYQKAAVTYGGEFFKVNITLCEQRLKGSKSKDPVLPGSPAESRQLNETQRLLEHYYCRCQELEYQLLDNATK